MIAREVIAHAFRSTEIRTEEVAVENKTEKAAYESPTLNTIGTAQKLLQGGWCTGDYDGYSNSFSRSY